MTHEFAKVSERGLHQEMEVVVHEDIGVELDGIDVQGQGDHVKEFFSILIIHKNVSPLISPARYVIYRARKLDSQWSGHGFFYCNSLALSTIKI